MSNTYKAFFYTEADWAETTIKAATPEQALQRAHRIESGEETETLDFQSYDCGGGVEHIEIRVASDHLGGGAAPLPGQPGGMWRLLTGPPVG